MRARPRSVEPAVATLVLLETAVFALEVGRGDSRSIDAFALIPYDVTHGIVLAQPGAPLPVLTLVTAQFVHASWPHLAGNLIVLGLAGPPIERALGAVRFVAFYLTCGTFGSLAVIGAAPSSHVPVVGASGAIAGLLGAYLIVHPLARFGPYGLFVPALFIGAWALLQFEHGFGTVDGGDALTSGVAYFAHIGGFLAGIITIGLFASTRSAWPGGGGRR